MWSQEVFCLFSIFHVVSTTRTLIWLTLPLGWLLLHHITKLSFSHHIFKVVIWLMLLSLLFGFLLLLNFQIHWQRNTYLYWQTECTVYAPCLSELLSSQCKQVGTSHSCFHHLRDRCSLISGSLSNNTGAGKLGALVVSWMAFLNTQLTQPWRGRAAVEQDQARSRAVNSYHDGANMLT